MAGAAVNGARGKRAQAWLLAIMLATAALGGGLCYSLGRAAPHPAYGAMAAAQERMQACLRAVKGYKARRGIPLNAALDPNQTGLIGVDSSAVTTTAGALCAKRTAADPVMAALCVRLLWEAGVREGSRIACCFSGSFPGLNIAVVTACEALGAEPAVMVSVGASAYGGNDEGLTAPEQLHLLYEDGLLAHAPAGVTWGGQGDAGESLLGRLLPGGEAALAKIGARLTGAGLAPADPGGFEENLRWRMACYGDADCFVNVGGNVMALGENSRGLESRCGILTGVGSSRAGAGLIQRYLARGTPVIHLLNLKKLTARYGLPYDPPALAPVGRAAVYYTRAYPKGLILGTLALLALELFSYRRALFFLKKENCLSHPSPKGAA